MPCRLPSFFPNKDTGKNGFVCLPSTLHNGGAHRSFGWNLNSGKVYSQSQCLPLHYEFKSNRNTVERRPSHSAPRLRERFSSGGQRRCRNYKNFLWRNVDYSYFQNTPPRSKFISNLFLFLCRGFGFIVFNDSTPVDKVLEFTDCHIIDGKKVSIFWTNLVFLSFFVRLNPDKTDNRIGHQYFQNGIFSRG